MKKKLYILIAAFLIVISGCSKENTDLLDKQASGDLNADNVFLDYNMTIEYLNGIYSNMPFGWKVFNQGMFDGIIDDLDDRNSYGGSNTFNSGSLNANNLIAGFTHYYRGIRGANTLLENIDRVIVPENITNPELQIQSMKNQARFCRAYIYTALFEMQGGVPILTQSADPKKPPVLTQRSTYLETAEWLCSEYDALAAVLPLQWDAVDYNRPTKGAALAAKARVLLQLASPAHNTDTPYGPDPNFMVHAPYSKERWKRASDAAKAVIDMGYYVLKPGKSGYYSVWFDHSYNNKEYILSKGAPTSNFLEYLYLPLSARFTGGKNSGSADMFPTQNLVDAYEVLQTVGGVTTAVPFDWNNPVHKANPYKNRDPRMKLSVHYNGANLLGYKIETFQGGLDQNPLGYFVKKFLDSTMNLSNNTLVYHDFPYIRYSDVLLMYAEAENEYVATPSADVYNAVNLVRNRVGMPSLPAGLTQAQMRERIRNERHVELAFEQRRIFDVKRWLIQEETQKVVYRIDIVKNTDGSFTYSRGVAENRIFLPAHIMWPIPDADVQNAGLFQNPLY